MANTIKGRHRHTGAQSGRRAHNVRLQHLIHHAARRCGHAKLAAESRTFSCRRVVGTAAEAKPRLTALELRRRVCVLGLLRTGRFDDQFYVHEVDALERAWQAFEATRARSVGIGTRTREDRIFAL